MNVSKKSLFFLAFAAACVFPVLIRAEDPPRQDSASAWLNHVRRCMRPLFSIKASFVEEHLAKHREIVDKLEGMLETRRGGRYRLTYTAPMKRLVVSDGVTVWAYDRAASTAYSSPAETDMAVELAALLAGDGNTGAFSARLIGGSAGPEYETGPGVVEIVPEEAHPFVSTIALTLEQACPSIRRVLIVYKDGSATRITLSDVKTNIGMGKRRFAFTPPRGTRIVTP